MATIDNAARVIVKGMKVILYGEDGKKYIYKFGDPEGDKELHVEINTEQEYEEIDTLLHSSMMFKTKPATYTFKVTP